MAAKSEDEFFSADSLEEFGESTKRKISKLKVFDRKKKRKTYSELNQHFVLSEFMKLRADKISQNSDGSSLNETLKYPSKSPSTENVELPKEPQKVTKKSKIPRILWSEYLSNKYKTTQSESIKSSESFRLRKRIEYGRQMSSMNRINQQCQKLHKKLNCQQNHTADSKVSESVSSIVETTKNNSKALKPSSSSSSKDVKVNKEEELELKLECLQIRHQNDRNKVEKMKNALMNEKIISKEQ